MQILKKNSNNRINYKLKSIIIYIEQYEKYIYDKLQKQQTNLGEIEIYEISFAKLTGEKEVAGFNISVYYSLFMHSESLEPLIFQVFRILHKYKSLYPLVKRCKSSEHAVTIPSELKNINFSP